MPDKDDRRIGEKLLQARKATGMSTRRVAEVLPPSVPLSHATIANYESGRSQPTMEALSALASIYQRPLTWFLQSTAALTGIRYRNRKSKVGVRELAQFEATAQKWVDAYRALEETLNTPFKPDLADVRFAETVRPATAARKLREKLGLHDDDPVPSVVEVLERVGVRTLELSTALAIDAMAATAGTEPVVVLNPVVSNERSRLNATHELGHVVFGDCKATSIDNHGPTEDRAFDFASSFLLTDTMLAEAFADRSMVRLVKYKERFGISIAAMVYRAERQRIIPKVLAKHLWIEFNRRGWRTREPGNVKEDRATRFEQLLDGAILQQKLTWQTAAQLTGVREDELRQRVELALGIDEPPAPPAKGGEDKPFMRLVK